MNEKIQLAKLLIQAIKLGSIEGEKAIFSALRKHYVVQKESSNTSNLQMFNTPALKAINPQREFLSNGTEYRMSGKLEWIKLFKKLTGCTLREGKDEFERRFPKTD